MHYRCAASSLVLFAASVAFAGCHTGPAINGSFSRTFSVTGPIRLELSNASGDVTITGGAPGTVSIHADVRASGFGFDNPQKRLDEIVSHPPVEQRSDTIRIGKDLSRMRNISIAYTIQVPHDTESDVSVASGTPTIRDVAGPVKVRSASGSIHVENIDRDVQLATASGSVSADKVGSDVHASSASGNVTVSSAKGDVRANSSSGNIRISQPGGRVEAGAASGDIKIAGAANDVKARSASGRVFVEGNPGSQGYWDLKSTSGGVQISVPFSANFHLSAEAVSGEIRADIPIIIEEQGKHSLRAHVGNGGGRVEVHTVSGEIRITGLQ